MMELMKRYEISPSLSLSLSLHAGTNGRPCECDNPERENQVEGHNQELNHTITLILEF